LRPRNSVVWLSRHSQGRDSKAVNGSHYALSRGNVSVRVSVGDVIEEHGRRYRRPSPDCHTRYISRARKASGRMLNRTRPASLREVRGNAEQDELKACCDQQRLPQRSRQLIRQVSVAHELNCCVKRTGANEQPGSPELRVSPRRYVRCRVGSGPAAHDRLGWEADLSGSKSEDAFANVDGVTIDAQGSVR
jgi:hypothetical protein